MFLSDVRQPEVVFFFLNFGQWFCPKGQFGEIVCGYWCLKG